MVTRRGHVQLVGHGRRVGTLSEALVCPQARRLGTGEIARKYAPKHGFSGWKFDLELDGKTVRPPKVDTTNQFTYQLTERIGIDLARSVEEFR